MTILNMFLNNQKKGMERLYFWFHFRIICGINFFYSKKSYRYRRIKIMDDKIGCIFVDYELTCNVEKYESENILLDLNLDKNKKVDKMFIFMREEFIMGGMTGIRDNAIPYEYVLNSEETSFADLINFINIFISLMFVLFLIGGAFFYLIGNVILALVMMTLINSIMKTKFTFGQMYKLTIYTSIPYVLFNAITRIIIGVNLSLLMPNIMLTILIDYIVIFVITYIVVKKGYEVEQPQEEVVLPFET